MITWIVFLYLVPVVITAAVCVSTIHTDGELSLGDLLKYVFFTVCPGANLLISAVGFVIVFDGIFDHIKNVTLWKRDT